MKTNTLLHNLYEEFDVDLPVGWELGIPASTFEHLIKTCFSFLETEEQKREFLLEMTPNSDNDKYFINRNIALVKLKDRLWSYTRYLKRKKNSDSLTDALTLLRLIY